jgi:DHA3 family macrolide efflux protein-like MFS transporter
MENTAEETIPKKTFRGFLWLFFTQYISLIGSQLVSFSVIWYLTEVEGRAIILSLATMANMIPMILVSPFAGVIADRRNKNNILLITDATQALATLVLIMLFFFGVFDVWQILVLMAIRGTCQGFQLPAVASLNILMVPEKHIQRINAIDRILMSILSIVTPIFGAFILNYMTLNQIYWFDVVTFIPTAIVLLIVKIPQVKSEGKDKLQFWSDFKSSIKYMKETHLFSPFILFAVANFFVVPLFSLLPLVVKDYHGGLEMEYGYMMAAVQIGMLVGGIILMLIKKKPKMRGVIINGFLMSIALIILAAIPNYITWNFWAIYGVAFILGLLITFIDTQLFTILQVTIPKEYQGRIFSTLFTIIKSIMPLGLVLWGYIGDLFPSIIYLFFLAPGLSIIAFFVIIMITPIFKFDKMHKPEPQKEISEPIEENSPLE